MKIITNSSGHITVIFLGSCLIYSLVGVLRNQRLKNLLVTPIDKMVNDVDALIHVNILQEWISNGYKSGDVIVDMHIKGYINLHVDSCVNEGCVCKNVSVFFDVATSQYCNAHESFH